jgi:hypothetical protein
VAYATDLDQENPKPGIRARLFHARKTLNSDLFPARHIHCSYSNSAGTIYVLETTMKEHFKKQLEVMGEFFGHIVMGVVMFIGMLGGGWIVKFIVHFAEPIFGGASYSSAMEVIEFIFLWADVAFLVWWCIYSTIRACKALMK